MPDIRTTLKDIFFPTAITCDICGIETFDGNICPDCLKTIHFNSSTRCPVCGRKTETDQICLECKAQAPVYKKAVSPLVYEDGAVLLITKFKNGAAYLKKYLSGLMAEAVRDLPEFDCIVYVPMTKKSQKARGYNQTKLLAECLADTCCVQLSEDAVEKVKDTDVQKGLSRKDRAENLKGCFKVRDKELIKGKRVLICDDVLTTGATADEIAKTLIKAKAKAVYLVTAASVEYKSDKQKKKV